MPVPRLVSTVVSVTVLLAVVTALLWGAAVWTRSMGESAVKERATDALNIYVTNLASELEKYASLPQILARQGKFVRLLTQTQDPQHLRAANLELEHYNELANALDTYLIDRDGIVVAASNWRLDSSFVSEDLNFRPYFFEALEAESANYFALGTTSNKRGYYFSAPIKENASVIGVVVVKVDMASLETAWSSGGENVLVTDSDGIIFITTQPRWLYHSLKPLSPATREKLRASRRYSSIEPAELPIEHAEALDSNTATFKLREHPVGAGKPHFKTYLQRSAPMPSAGWVVHILVDLAPVEDQVTTTLLTLALLFAVAMLIAALIRNRKQARAQAQLLEQRTHDALQEAYGQLEERVSERTAQLSDINVQLGIEIQERKTTELALRNTQDDLVQAAKLAALGQMAAGISHELNQPLGAVRTFADNALTLIERERIDDAKSTVTLIAQLVDRMGVIMKQLRTFASKTPLTLKCTSLNQAIRESLILLEPQTKATAASIVCKLPEPEVFVHAEPVRLEQVLVNLISNGLDAVVNADERRITILIDARSTKVSIEVLDTGAGMASGDVARVFEPFFTTKAVGKGLGLGLSVSYGIVQEFGGTLEACNDPSGGARFALTLRRAHPGGNEE